MSPSESDLINAKITARKRELHAEAVADVGRRLLDCQHNLVAEAQRLWSTGEMLARSYKQLSTELSDSIAAGDPLDTAILEKAKVALVQVPERLTSVASLHQQSFGLLQRLLDQTGRPSEELEEDPVLLQLCSERRDHRHARARTAENFVFPGLDRGVLRGRSSGVAAKLGGTDWQVDLLDKATYEPLRALLRLLRWSDVGKRA